MAYVEYVPRSFRPESLYIIEEADRIASAMAADGYTLTLRQLFYQFVQAGILPNTERSYDRLGSLVNDGRLAGLIDWDHIVDRTRSYKTVPHWETPEEGVGALADQYRIDKWADQRYRVEVWVEKEALVDVVERPARRYDLGWFACRGYVSQSAQHDAAMRYVRYLQEGQQPVILHLGDHDPSGIDMSRDIVARLNVFVAEHVDGGEVELRRLALNLDQVRARRLPPNPAKAADSRFRDYLATYGDESWELDALDPPTIDALIANAVESLRDGEAYDVLAEREETERELLAATALRWDEVAEFLTP